MKRQIKHGYTDAVLFECEVPDTVASGMAIRHALEQATKAGTDLSGANLCGANLRDANLNGAYLRGANLSYAHLRYANLRGANLNGAYLRYANLSCANLSCANLRDADLRDAYLRGADLRGADLRVADLSGAYLSGAYLSCADLSGEVKLIGERPVFQIGPIGSRCAYFTAYITDQGVLVTAGCFKQKTIEEFRAKLIEEHNTNEHRREYEAALMLIETHADIWTPKAEIAKGETI